MSSSLRLNLPSDDDLATASGSPSTYKDYVKKNSSKNIRIIDTPKAELRYREKHSVSDTELEREKLCCTTCGKSLKLYLTRPASLFAHPVLGVLLCKSCAEFYGEGEFSVDEDETDKYCRWCGQGGKLYLCSECNYGFCHACIKRNLPRSYLKEVLDDNWKCFACESKPLWDLRAQCVATINLAQKKTIASTKSKSSKSRRGKFTSSDSEEEQVKKKANSQKQKKKQDSSSETSDIRKRKRYSSSEEEKQQKKKKRSSEVPQRKDEQNKTLYKKSIDRETTLDTKSAEKLVSKCTEQAEDLRKVLRAVTMEVKTLLNDDIVVTNMLEYSGRSKVFKKICMLQDMTCQSITQVCENFVLAYQGGIVSYVNTISEKKDRKSDLEHDKSKKAKIKKGKSDSVDMTDSEPDETKMKRKKSKTDSALSESEPDESEKSKAKKNKNDSARTDSEPDDESEKPKKKKSNPDSAMSDSEPDEPVKIENKRSKSDSTRSDSEPDESKNTKMKKSKTNAVSNSEPEESEKYSKKKSKTDKAELSDSEPDKSKKSKMKKSKFDKTELSDSEPDKSEKLKKKGSKSVKDELSDSEPDKSEKQRKKESKSGNAVSDSEPEESDKVKKKNKSNIELSDSEPDESDKAKKKNKSDKVELSDSEPDESDKAKKKNKSNKVELSDSEPDADKAKKKNKSNKVEVSDSEPDVSENTRKKKSKTGTALSDSEPEESEKAKKKSKSNKVELSDSEHDESEKVKKKKSETSTVLSDSEPEETEKRKKKASKTNSTLSDSEPDEVEKANTKKSKIDNALSESEPDELEKSNKRERKTVKTMLEPESEPDESEKKNKKNKSGNSEPEESEKLREKESKSEKVVLDSESVKIKEKASKTDKVEISDSEPDESNKTKGQKNRIDSAIEESEKNKKSESEKKLPENGSDEESHSNKTEQLKSRKSKKRCKTNDESTHENTSESDSDDHQVHNNNKSENKSKSNVNAKQNKCENGDDKNTGDKESGGNNDDHECTENSDGDLSSHQLDCELDRVSDNSNLSDTDTVILTPSHFSISKHKKQREQREKYSLNNADSSVHDEVWGSKKKLSTNAKTKDIVSNERTVISDSDDDNEVHNSDQEKESNRKSDLSDLNEENVAVIQSDEDVISNSDSENGNSKKKNYKLGQGIQQKCSTEAINSPSSKDALNNNHQKYLTGSGSKEIIEKEIEASNLNSSDRDKLAEPDVDTHTQRKSATEDVSSDDDRNTFELNSETNSDKAAFYSDEGEHDKKVKHVLSSNGVLDDSRECSDDESCSKQKPLQNGTLNDRDKLDSDEETQTKNKTKKSSNIRNTYDETKTNGIAGTDDNVFVLSDDSEGNKSDKKSVSLLSGRKLDKYKKVSIDGKSRSDKIGDEDENRKAMLSLLASSSSEDDSIRFRKKRKKECAYEKCGPLSSKSLSYQMAHRNEQNNKFSDASEGMDLDSDEQMFKVKKICGRSFQDLVKEFKIHRCSIVVDKLPEDVYQKYFKASHSSEEDCEVKKSEADEINRLVNLRNLDCPRKKIPSVDSDSESEEGNVNKKKVLRKHAKKPEKKKEKETLKDFHDDDDDDGLSSQSNRSDISDKNNKKGEGLINVLENLNKTRDKLAEELLLRSSSSDSDSDIFVKKTKEKEKKKEAKAKVKEENKDDKDEEKDKSVKKANHESDDTDESEVEMKKRKKWRSDKLLSMKLSETDTSEDERKWKAKQEREAKQEEKESDSEEAHALKKKRKKPSNRRRLLASDSDVQLITSESSSDDSDNFKPINKRKRKGGSNSDKSVKLSESDSDKSVKKKTKRRRIRKPVSDSSDSDGADLNNSQKSDTTPSKGRKNIRKVMKDDTVAEATRQAAKEEEERRKRIAEKQKLYNALYSLAEAQAETTEQLVLDFDSELKKQLVEVDKNLVKKLKPHQVKGVKFMWDACFESLEMVKKNDGSGCILAHCMGLGKTLQVIALTHTVLNNPKTKVKSVLIVCPLSTVLNWVSEFSKWLDLAEENDIEVLELTRYKQTYERIGVLKHWHEHGGVMILGYSLYRSLTNPKQSRMKKRCIEVLQKTLVEPGPDLVICDEGHLLKNEESALSKAMSRLKTKRRIVLTGTPLQNNLLEYHCMVQFVKPNLLGTKKEFKNRFINPINNGQYDNSTAHDVKVMKRRAHVLHKMLDSSVQRFDYSVLTPFLPPKFEYVLVIRLTERQIQLYKYYLENFAFGSADGQKTKTARLFSDFTSLSRIWTHPRVLLMNAEKEEKKQLLEESDSEGSLRDFVVSTTSDSSSSSSSDSDIEEISGGENKKKKAHKPRTRAAKKNAESDDNSSVKSVEASNVDGETKDEIDYSREWWRQIVTEDSQLDDIRESGKLSLLFTILEECEKIGDKVLVFSQSLFSLDLIEYFLSKIDDACQSDTADEKLKGHKATWVLGLDYFRLDGSSNAENRQAWCKSFNREDNYRARLFLISTRAGGLGINLVAANRVVLFDASWNPSHDVQSIFRVYRFGQKKPCYIYRFLAEHTMEEKIYNRQVTKLSLACRVVDEQQIERHYSMDDLQELYNFNPEEKKSKETPLVPKDILLAELVRGEDSWVNSYHEHDTLLENKEEEELNEDERKAAWEDYEKEKQGPRPSVAMYDNSAIMAYLSQFGYTEDQIRDSIIRENPQWSEAQIHYHVSRVLRQLLDYVSAEEYRKQIQAHYNITQQPGYNQGPQTQGIMQMQQQVQSRMMQNSQMQHQIVQNPQESVRNGTLPPPQRNSMYNIGVQPGTSAGTDAQHGGNNRIKVKSFGHMQNSNFGATKVMTNPFAAHTNTNPSQKVGQQQVNVVRRAGAVNNQQAVKKNPPSRVNDVIEVE